jgi:hypothetical protein
MSTREEPPAAPKNDSPEHDTPEPERDSKSQGHPWWSWRRWGATKEERADRAKLSSALTALTLILALVQLYVHQPTVALTLSIVLAIAGPTALLLIRRGFIRTVKLRVGVMVAGGLVAVLAGVVIGAFIKNITNSPAPSHPISARATQRPATPTPSSSPPSSPSPSPSSKNQASITTPTDGTSVGDGFLSASGTVRQLPPGYRLDLFLKTSLYPVFYAAGDPNTTLTITGDHWSGKIFIGVQPCSAILYLVELSPASVRTMNIVDISDQSGGYPSITALGPVLAAVTLSVS